MFSTRTIRRTAAVAVVVAGAAAAPAGAATLTVKAPTIGCCNPSTATNIAWSVARAAGASAPTLSKVVVTRPPDANTMLFFRATAGGTPIDTVVYDTSILRYCLTGSRMERMETKSDGSEELTFSFTALKVYVPSLRAAWSWNAAGTKPDVQPC